MLLLQIFAEMPSAVNGCAGAADDVVLTGLSGRLPESDSIEEFAKNLFDGVDLVTDDDRRWAPGEYPPCLVSPTLLNLLLRTVGTWDESSSRPRRGGCL